MFPLKSKVFQLTVDTFNGWKGEHRNILGKVVVRRSGWGMNHDRMEQKPQLRKTGQHLEGKCVFGLFYYLKFLIYKH